MNYHLAIDLGASSGRCILGYLNNGKIILDEVHRFDNLQERRDGHDCWDIKNLWDNIIEGLKKCKAIGKIPSTLGVDTWGVDFVLVYENGDVIGDCVAYRDKRTEGMDKVCEEIISFEDLYARCGIQKQMFNTIYQLLAVKRENPEHLKRAKKILMMPDYLNYLLSGVMANEYTEASTSSLVNAETKQWDLELIEMLGLPTEIFGKITMPGVKLGNLSPEVQAQVGFDCEVILPATHDTGSAFLAVPARDDNAIYISSGTWSLLGIENPVPLANPTARDSNLTNEGGYNSRYRILKNIMGLWMIQSIRRELNGVNYVKGREDRVKSDRTWSFAELCDEAKKFKSFTSKVDVNDNAFLSPDSMIEAVKDYCRKTNQAVPETVGELLQCVYTSLATCYGETVMQLEKLSGKKYTSINIVGGGCKDDYLSELTARATGLEVFAGPSEGTSLGNMIVQFIYSGEFKSLEQARRAVFESFDIQTIK